MFSTLQHTFQQRFRAWLEKRLPPQRSIVLNQSKIFIFPSRAGLCFISVMIVLLLVAINYQNNMVFALVFLLISAFIVTILHTFANLSGLSITAVRSWPAVAGDMAAFELKLQRENARPYFDVSVCWPDSEVISVSLTDQVAVHITLHLTAHRRGILHPPRLLLETYYPLGLLRCWTWLDLDIDALVYPRPIQGQLSLAATASGEDIETVVVSGPGNDDFYAFKDYQPGDPLKHIAWKAFAKGQSLKTKQYAAYQNQQCWLDWNGVSGDTETRLSILCHWVLLMEQRHLEYGLRLPGAELPPGTGEKHRDGALKLLALFDQVP